MDLLYQGKYLRFTTCLEKEAPCDLKNVGKDNIKSIRLKMRTSFYFQFMEFCFTEVLQLQKTVGKEAVGNDYYN